MMRKYLKYVLPILLICLSISNATGACFTFKTCLVKASSGDAQAQLKLGAMYATGRGIQQDDKAAVKWFKQAAERGVAGAQYNLGLMYEIGRGVTRNYIQAYAWYNISASNGLNTASSDLDNLSNKMTHSQIEIAQQLSKSITHVS